MTSDQGSEPLGGELRELVGHRAGQPRGSGWCAVSAPRPGSVDLSPGPAALPPRTPTGPGLPTTASALRRPS